MSNRMLVMLLTLSELVVALFIWKVGYIGKYVDEKVVYRAMDAQGFTNVRVLKRDTWWVSTLGGSESDDVRFTVEAINPIGKRVTVYVFAGWPYKGATIRMP